VTNAGESRFLSDGERWVAGAAGVILVILALALVLAPPDRTEAIDGCSPRGNRACTAEVDGNTDVFAGVLAALGGAALLVGLLGIRFSSIKAGGVELAGVNFEDATKGLAPAGTASAVVEPADTVEAEGLEVLDGVSAGTAELPQPITATDTEYLNQYRRQVYDEHRDVFLTHLLGPPTMSGQQFRVALFLTGHGEPVTPELVESAVMYFGRHWGSQRFQATWGADGKLGVVTEAYGPFLALCEVTFTDGQRVLMHHHVDFEMRVLLERPRT
jgi:prokaryotic YEATS domain